VCRSLGGAYAQCRMPRGLARRLFMCDVASVTFRGGEASSHAWRKLTWLLYAGQSTMTSVAGDVGCAACIKRQWKFLVWTRETACFQAFLALSYCVRACRTGCWGRDNTRATKPTTSVPSSYCHHRRAGGSPMISARSEVPLSEGRCGNGRSTGLMLRYPPAYM
jgi:hypothetical protein